jgi:hypothetical protein
LNRVTQIVAERAKAAGLPLEPFTVHDLRRTGSTLLNEIGFNRDWNRRADLRAEADAGERGGAGAPCDRVRGGVAWRSWGVLLPMVSCWFTVVVKRSL